MENANRNAVPTLPPSEERPLEAETKKKASLFREVLKRLLNLFWTWLGFDALAEDFESHETTAKKAKALILLMVIAFLGLFVGYWFRGNSDSSEIREQAKTIGDLRHENSKLVADNSRLKTVMDPIERKAREIYPELESSAAIAKLAKDLEDTRNLATRAEFKPLSAQLQEQIVGGLKQIGQAHDKMTLVVGYQTGNLGRAKLAQELSSLLQVGGMSVRFEGGGIYGPESFETPVRVFVNPEGQAAKTYGSYLQPISRLLASGIVPVGNRSTATNEIVIQILGTPAFLPDGSVLFQ